MVRRGLGLASHPNKYNGCRVDIGWPKYGNIGEHSSFGAGEAHGLGTLYCSFLLFLGVESRMMCVPDMNVYLQDLTALLSQGLLGMPGAQVK